MNNQISLAHIERKRFASHLRRFWAVSLLFLLLIPAAVPTVAAADGDLDTTFGSGGKVLSDIFVNTLKLQSDGKIVVAGGDAATLSFALARCNTNGSLDA